MEAKEFTAKTIEEAIAEGLKELGLTEDEAEIEILDNPQKGFLGIGSKPARVSVKKKQTDGERAESFIEGLFEIVGIPATTELKEDENSITVNVVTTTSSAVIGYRGEVLDAIQCLAGAVANKGKEEYLRVVVDCEGYRGKREETLKNLAEKLAAKAVRTGRKVSLEPMNPFERRVIHFALADNTEVKTVSEGKEPNRYISIIPNNMTSARPIREDRKGYGDKKRGGYNREGGNRERRGYNRDGGRERRTSGFSSMSKPQVKRSGFGGTYLGNSLKDNQNND